MFPFYIPWKHQETKGAFRGYKMGILARNGLIFFLIYWDDLVRTYAKYVGTYESTPPLDGTHLDAVRGLTTKRFSPKCVSTGRARRSDANSFDKD